MAQDDVGERILLLGSGGREHALAWKIAQSPLVKTFFASPGSDAIGKLARVVDLALTHHQAVIDFCQSNAISLVVIGPEAPLVDGLADSLRAANIATFGPCRDGAQLEGSKGFTKDLCREADIPTAGYARFEALEPALRYIENQPFPLVIKADGLAAGKGVVIADSPQMARDTITDILGGSFGSAGASIVIEEFLVGEEVSVFALTDGDNIRLLLPVQDHKRAFDGDTGPNTGGMGAYAPAPALTDDLEQRVVDEILLPTLDCLRKRGISYQGILYAGLMLTDDGPKLIEYNARFGDPECQVLMLLMESDILPYLLACASGGLDNMPDIQWYTGYAMTVVMAARGYPGSYKKESLIKGIDNDQLPDTLVFEAGTKHQGGQVLSNGGRVLNICARATNVRALKKIAYARLGLIDWPSGFFRRDIGHRLHD